IHPAEQTLGGSTKPIFFASAMNETNTGWRHVPMASGLEAETKNGESFSQPTQPAGLESFVQIPENASAAPQAKWVTYETDAQGRQWRYAYWIEGLNGYLDGDLADLVVRGDGLDARELDWYSFFDPKADVKPENGPGNEISAARGKVLSAGNLGLLLDEEE